MSTEFVNTVIKALDPLSGFEHQFILAYHPEADRAAKSHVVLAQRQQHTKPEKVKEGKKSLFFDSTPHVTDTPYCVAGLSFIEHPLLLQTLFSSKIPTGLLAHNPECDGHLESFCWQLENN
ncbi:hypothetical protein QOT17_006960 [Balamuthia mandrillaris]